MEEIVKLQTARYSSQREDALRELISLNENLPNYIIKKTSLEMEIERIDRKIIELLFFVERQNNSNPVIDLRIPSIDSQLNSKK